MSVIAGGSAGGQRNEAAIKNALAEILSAFQTMDPGTGQNAGPLVLSGWFYDDVTGVRLENEQPKTANINLLVVHLPTPGGYEVAPRPVLGTPMSGSGGGFGMIRRGPTFPAQPGMPVPGPVRAAPRPMTANDYNALAYTYANQGKLDLALNAARNALRMAPQDGNILDSVAEMHQRRKEYRQAASYYALAISHQPNGGMTETHEKYGETLIALGDRANGIRHLQSAAADTSSRYGVLARQQLQKLGVQP